MTEFPNIIMDFDSTFIQVEALELLADLALADQPQREAIRDQLKDITRRGMEGTLPFDQSLRQRLALFRPHRRHVTALARQLAALVTPSVQRRRRFFVERRDRLYVVSGGFREYITPLCSAYGLRDDHIFANSFCFDGSGWVTGFDEACPLAQEGGKARQVIALRLAGPTWVLGDGMTDCQIKEAGAADRFLAFVENVTRPAVVAKADAVISDLEALEAMLE